MTKKTRFEKLCEKLELQEQNQQLLDRITKLETENVIAKLELQSALRERKNLRDHFAGQALVGFLSGNLLENYFTEAGITGMEAIAEAYAEKSGVIADAMIEERNKR